MIFNFLGPVVCTAVHSVSNRKLKLDPFNFVFTFSETLMPSCSWSLKVTFVCRVSEHRAWLSWWTCGVLNCSLPRRDQTAWLKMLHLLLWRKILPLSAGCMCVCVVCCACMCSHVCSFWLFKNVENWGELDHLHTLFIDTLAHAYCRQHQADMSLVLRPCNSLSMTWPAFCWALCPITVNHLVYNANGKWFVL